MLLALTGYETALLIVALCFISFALVAALVVPRYRPTFPGRWLWLFLLVCVLFFAAQLTAVFVLASVGEADEPVAGESASGETSESTATETTTTDTTSTETTATETTATETTATGTTTTEAVGDAAAGKAVFTGSSGCSGCHTLADAGATGNVGPNLDAVKPSYEKVVTQVTNGGGVMPAFGDTLTEQQIQDVAAYVSSVAGT